jgi:hypothetical protein
MPSSTGKRRPEMTEEATEWTPKRHLSLKTKKQRQKLPIPEWQ